MRDGIDDVAALDIETSYSRVLAESVWLRKGIDGYAQECAPQTGTSATVRLYLGSQAWGLLTSRGTSWTAAADDTNVAAKSAEYFIVAAQRLWVSAMAL